MKISIFLMVALVVVGAGPAVQAQSATVKYQNSSPGAPTLYFHPYKPALKGSFQLQPEQGFSIVSDFSGFVRMVQVCVRDAKAKAAMPVPTPMLVTRTKRGPRETPGLVSVGSCVLLEGESISVGLVDGTVDTDTSEANSRNALSYMAGSYIILGYYSTIAPIVPVAKDD
jgi:hypothetical protein